MVSCGFDETTNFSPGFYYLKMKNEKKDLFHPRMYVPDVCQINLTFLGQNVLKCGNNKNKNNIHPNWKIDWNHKKQWVS